MAEHIIVLTDEQEAALSRTIIENTEEGKDPVDNTAYLQMQASTWIDSYVRTLKAKDLQIYADVLRSLPEKDQAELINGLYAKKGV